MGDDILQLEAVIGDVIPLSMCLFIQPEIFLKELFQMDQGGDGILDHLLFITEQPFLHDPQVLNEFYYGQIVPF